MRKFVLLILIFSVTVLVAQAGTWNRYPYKVFSAQSYRQNYVNHTNYKPVPYTQYQYNNVRNYNYSNFSNMNNFNNYVYKASPSNFYSRGVRY